MVLDRFDDVASLALSAPRTIELSGGIQRLAERQTLPDRIEALARNACLPPEGERVEVLRRSGVRPQLRPRPELLPGREKAYFKEPQYLSHGCSGLALTMKASGRQPHQSLKMCLRNHRHDVVIESPVHDLPVGITARLD